MQDRIGVQSLDELDDSECCVRCDTMVEWRDENPTERGLGLCDPCAQELLGQVKEIVDRTFQRERE